MKSQIEKSVDELWDIGSSGDRVRNDFVIPNIARSMERTRPETILDVGSATGQIAREIDRKLSFSPHWTLTDISETRLKYANAQLPSGMSARTIRHDITTSPVEREHYAAALATFTLLEIDQIEKAIRHLVQSLRIGGIIYVALPDVWRDALAAKEDYSTLVELLDERTSISKIDKFTGKPYPFHAARLERIIEWFLINGCVLTDLEKSAPNGEVFLLTFERIRN